MCPDTWQRSTEPPSPPPLSPPPSSRRHPRRCQWGNRLSELLPRRCHPRYTTLAAAIFALPRAGMPPLPSVACMALHYSLRFVPCVSVWRWRDDRCREDVMYENCMMPDVISVMRRVQWPMLCGGLVLRTVSKCPRSGRFAASKPPLVVLRYVSYRYGG